MTILMRLEKPGLELTVCGTPSRAWLDGLALDEGGIAQGQGGLTEGQWAWRAIHKRAAANRNPDAPASTGPVVGAATPPRRRARRRPAPGTGAARFDLVDTEEL